MKFKDLLESGLIEDRDKITVIKPLVITGAARVIRRGNWFNDYILDFSENEVKAFSWTQEDGFIVTLA